MKVIKSGNREKIWWGTIVCSNCGANLKIKFCEIQPHSKQIIGNKEMYLSSFSCVECGHLNVIDPVEKR